MLDLHASSVEKPVLGGSAGSSLVALPVRSRAVTLAFVAALHIAALAIIFRPEQSRTTVLHASPKTRLIVVELRPPPRASQPVRSNPVRRVKKRVTQTSSLAVMRVVPPKSPRPAPPSSPADRLVSAPPHDLPVPSAAAIVPDPPPPATQPAAIARTWSERVAAWIQGHKAYPEMARIRREQGAVCVRVTVARDGRAVAVTLTCSSGSALLDAAARNLFASRQLPPFPRSMPQEQVSVDLVLDYSLRR